MPKVRIISAHYHMGIGGVKEGDVIELDEAEARAKIQKGYAEAYVEPPAQPKVEKAKAEKAKNE